MLQLCLFFLFPWLVMFFRKYAVEELKECNEEVMFWGSSKWQFIAWWPPVGSTPLGPSIILLLYFSYISGIIMSGLSGIDHKIVIKSLLLHLDLPLQKVNLHLLRFYLKNT